MNTDHERKTASERVEIFRSRYHHLGEECLPLQIAIRWQRAVSTDPVDLNTLKDIFDTAKASKNKFDVGFFTFCNHMETVIQSGWRDSFK